jgi:hypothetical protein
LAELVRLYGLRKWVEPAYRQVKGALGWADVQVRADRAIRRHWQLVCCAFSFCWWAFLHGSAPATAAAWLLQLPAPVEPAVGEKDGSAGSTEPGPRPRQRPALSWPVALRQVQRWLDPWTMLWRCWRAWSTAPPPAPLQRLLDAVAQGHSLRLPLRI